MQHSFFVGLCVLGTKAESLKPHSLNRDLNIIIKKKKNLFEMPTKLLVNKGNFVDDCVYYFIFHSVFE